MYSFESGDVGYCGKLSGERESGLLAESAVVKGRVSADFQIVGRVVYHLYFYIPFIKHNIYTTSPTRRTLLEVYPLLLQPPLIQE